MKGHFAITLFRSPRNASKTPCADRNPYPRVGQLLRHLRLEHDDPAVLDLVGGNCERAVAEAHFKPAHGRIVPDVAFHHLLAHSSAPETSRPAGGDRLLAVLT
jgi:hypothetical protein